MTTVLPNFVSVSKPLNEILGQCYRKVCRQTNRGIRNLGIQSVPWGIKNSAAYSNLQEMFRNAVRLRFLKPEIVVCVCNDAPDKLWVSFVTQISAAELDKPRDQ